MPLTYLVIGMSHVGALIRAASDPVRPAFRIVNLRHEKADIARDAEARKAMVSRIAKADVLCFALEGNFHNVLSLMNDPEPFFMVPSAPQGHFVPQDMMQAHIDARHQRTLRLAQTIAEMFPARLRIVLDPPPPAGDAAHIARYPGVFVDKIGHGVSSAALRVAMYGLQSAMFRAHAKVLDAAFLPSPIAARDDAGMLAARYWNTDPTHGNAAYGQLVLDGIEALALQTMGKTA